jgi:hypothetical protein
MTKEKSQDQYYKEALAFITAGDKAHVESDSNKPSVLSFLARGTWFFFDVLRSAALIVLLFRCQPNGNA